MFVIRGTRKARIKVYHHHDRQCEDCRDFDLTIKVYKEYESKTRVPIYLYSGLLLIGLFILSLFAVSGWGAHERSQYISDPQVGDVYLMKTSQRVLEGYRFVRVTRITGDSVITIGNSVMYLTATSEFDSQDTFDNEEQVVLSKSGLKQLYQTDSIQNIFRDYGNSTGFNRIK